MSFTGLLLAEIKSAAKKLPLIISSGMLLLAVVMLFALALTSYSNNKNGGKSIIAISAPNDTFTNIAITAVENMDSVSELCRFVRTDKSEAEAMVVDNRASAALIFEENFVEDIISGKNSQPRILVSQNTNKLFTDLAKCGTSMLAAVQAGIYSAEKAYEEQTGTALPHSQNKELNMEYVDTVFSREGDFVKSSENILDIKDYYVCMLVPVFLLLFASSLGILIYPESNSFYEYSRLGFLRIASIQFVKIFVIYFVLFALLWCAAYFADIDMRFNILSVISLSFIVSAVYSLTDKKTAASLFIIIFTFVTAFASGAFVPPALMPDSVKSLSELMPVYNMGYQLMGECNLTYSIVLWAVCTAITIMGGKKRCLL